jgi:hypothetical protein
MKLTNKITILAFISMLILFNSCSKDDSSDDTAVKDTTTLKIFKDVAFTLDASEGYVAAKYFSTELGASYKAKQIDASILPKIDIAFNGSNSSLDYFLTPNDVDLGIKNAPLTLFVNYQKDLLTIDQFNKIEKGSDFDGIKITKDDGESFTDNLAPNIVLFKNAAGKIGAIYVKSVQRVGYDPKIIVDIKIQK